MHQSLCAVGMPVARPRLRPIGAVTHQRVLVAVIRTQPSLPSLAAGRAVAALRARGDEVRLAEFEGEGLLSLPRVGRDTDLVLLVDSEDQIRGFPANHAPDSMACAVDLVPDFSDYPFQRTRVLPIAASVPGATRPLGVVLHEIREYMRRYASPDLVFVDRAVNDDLPLLEGLMSSIQRHAHGVQWMAAVRVDEASSDGLSRKLLRSAAGAGLRSLVLRIEAGHAERRAQELASHAADAGIATRIVAEEPSIEVQRSNLRSELRGLGSGAFIDIALKD